MPISFKASMLLVAALSLTACLDSKSGDKKTALAIQDQTKVLQQQSDQAAQSKPVITLTGFVKNLNTDSKASNATAKIKVGNAFSDPVNINDSGAFQFENLAPGSNFELVIHSTTGVFLDRAVFGTTSASTSGKVFQDLGVISVAAGVEHHFKILDNDTNAPVKNLVLHASSNIGSGADEEQYFFTSTYDDSIQSYKITVPDLLISSVYASLDINHDGKNEYNPTDNRYGAFGHLTISQADLNNANNIYLTDLNAHEKVKVKITILDQNNSNIVGVMPTINDVLNGNLAATFDAVSNQYTFDALSDNGLYIFIPSIKIQNKTYNSSYIQIIKNSELNYDVTTNFNSRTYSFAEAGDKVFNLVVTMTELVPTAQVNVALTPFLSSNDTLKVFYTTPVKLTADGVSVVKKTVKVTKGDADSTDSISPGSTRIDNYDEPVAVTKTLTLDGTLLSITPVTPLDPNYTYNFNVNAIIDSVTNVVTDLSTDSYTGAKLSSFDVNAIKLDNENFKTNDTPIIASNTAGITPPGYYYNSASYVSLYFPLSIESLKTLKVRITSLTSGSTTTTYDTLYSIVDNGTVYLTKTQTVALAINESSFGSASNIITSSAQPDGQYYRVNLYLYLPDNTSSLVSTVTFNYTYDTKDGIHKSGTLTLPVM